MTTVGADEVDFLWRRYKETGSPELRNQLVLQYSPLVKYVAGRVRSGLPQSVDSADLVSEGVIGLMDAIERFEPDRGWAFQTYAVPRIRGAIIDSIRAADWVPRSVRSKLRDVEKAREALQVRLGRAPSDAELAAELDLTTQALRDLRERPTSVSTVEDDEVAALDDLAPAVDAALEDADTRQALLDALKTLPERDQIVIALYFFEGLTLGEIGQVLSVTESRVSQLRSRATASLRQGLAHALSS
ncbi:FliA/WhiG family RNA polymerase sigma factor [Nocardioides rubriscoriae]|uniref:FliA/WhiG family RNA polymerase sigma factor n=1 Tax=Nocardioides rubriscoriae TaxID=642762 RepID=UPI0011DF16C1|nr:FliA/WhiG family RNA polymerase sigma factor [Nocardioides rubriscoriae]